ncbi:MAG: HypC/HybG/HupF family hydrogenase formation chaperone [Gammaproteobacteria bacterium]|nr:HypC/HybG/HupF family hydrogenase formation chaperone [Gammaproteobacteria bacterium]
MCLGVPVRVIDSGNGMALCRGPNGDEHISMLLVGDQPPGTWVLSHLGWAREVVSAEDAANITRALEGVNALMNGADAIDVDHYFPGLGSAQEAS